jgi:hypothetical protein
MGRKGEEPPLWEGESQPLSLSTSILYHKLWELSIDILWTIYELFCSVEVNWPLPLQ